MRKDKNNETGLQNRFTAYLMAAVRNKRITYMEKKKRVQVSESGGMELLSKGHTDFEEIAMTHGITAKQAEMSYYYIIRKLRKELEGKRYD